MFNVKIFNALFLSIIILFCASCSDNSVQLPEYKIIKDTTKSNIKRSVEVELSERTSEKTLHLLAKKIHYLSTTRVERTFIGYRIIGDHENQAYWATTHYNPDLEVKILGENASNYQKLKSTALPDGKIIGSWMANWGYEYKITAYNKNNKTYIQSIFGDGSSSDKIYELSPTTKGMKLQDESGKEMGEYFIINKNGDLEFWGSNRNFYTAPKI